MVAMVLGHLGWVEEFPHADGPQLLLPSSNGQPCTTRSRMTYLGEFKAPAALEAAEGRFVRGALIQAVGEPAYADLLPLFRLLLHPVGFVDVGEALQTANCGAARRIMDISVES